MISGFIWTLSLIQLVHSYNELTLTSTTAIFVFMTLVGIWMSMTFWQPSLMVFLYFVGKTFCSSKLIRFILVPGTNPVSWIVPGSYARSNPKRWLVLPRLVGDGCREEFEVSLWLINHVVLSFWMWDINMQQMSHWTTRFLVSLLRRTSKCDAWIVQKFNPHKGRGDHWRSSAYSDGWLSIIGY